VIQFNQSDWLAKYIELNTEMWKKAKNDFEKDFKQRCIWYVTLFILFKHFY